MEIKWTDNALLHMKGQVTDKEQYISLKYDVEGCGCIVSGVWHLYITDEHSPDELEWRTNAYPVYINQNHTIFLDEEIIIDYSDQANTFQLKSPNQMLSPNMVCKRKVNGNIQIR